MPTHADAHQDSFRPYGLWARLARGHFEKTLWETGAGTPDLDRDQTVFAVELEDEGLDGILYGSRQPFFLQRFNHDRLDRRFPWMVVGEEHVGDIDAFLGVMVITCPHRLPPRWPTSNSTYLASTTSSPT